MTLQVPLNWVTSCSIHCSLYGVYNSSNRCQRNPIKSKLPNSARLWTIVSLEAYTYLIWSWRRSRLKISLGSTESACLISPVCLQKLSWTFCKAKCWCVWWKLQKWYNTWSSSRIESHKVKSDCVQKTSLVAKLIWVCWSGQVSQKPARKS